MGNEQKTYEQLTAEVEQCREVLAQQHKIIEDQRYEIEQINHKYETLRRAIRELRWFTTG